MPSECGSHRYVAAFCDRYVADSVHVSRSSEGNRESAPVAPTSVPYGNMLSMQTLNLSDIEAAVRASWGSDTSFATEEYMALGKEKPSRGQCGTTALVIQELLGGDLMIADVEHEGGVSGAHYWNITSGGIELDLTRDQFTSTETLVNPRRVTAQRNASTAGEQPFQLLKKRVDAALDEMRNFTQAN